MPDYMTIVWLVVFVVLLVVEAATAGLTSIWFAAGALAALLVSFIFKSIWPQVIVFVAVSGILLYFTRPLAKKYLNSRRMATNADRVLGGVYLVTEDIDNLSATGAVSAGGKVWTARSKSGEKIKTGQTVMAVAIEGVKLIVVPESATAEQTASAQSQA